MRDRKSYFGVKIRNNLIRWWVSPSVTRAVRNGSDSKVEMPILSLKRANEKGAMQIVLTTATISTKKTTQFVIRFGWKSFSTPFCIRDTEKIGHPSSAPALGWAKTKLFFVHFVWILQENRPSLVPHPSPHPSSCLTLFYPLFFRTTQPRLGPCPHGRTHLTFRHRNSGRLYWICSCRVQIFVTTLECSLDTGHGRDNNDQRPCIHPGHHRTLPNVRCRTIWFRGV